jgi:hypothetical protein
LNNILVPFPVVATTSTAMIDPATSSSSTPAVIPTPPAKVKLPYAIDNFSSDVNWQRTWGVMSVDDSHFLKVMSAADTSGGEVILGNTNDWIDYGMTATLDWVKGQTFMIIGRYQDPNNYVGCNFVKDSNAPGAVLIQLKKYVNGNGATIQTGEDFNFSQEGGSDVKVSLILQDSQATCSFNGHTISNTGGNSYGVSPFPGTIGFTTWDPAHNNTELTIKKVSVSANY